MYCKVCGKEISANQTFCPYCGQKNEALSEVKSTKKCVNCGKEFPEERVYCDACGGSLKLVTPIIPGVPVSNQTMQNQPNSVTNMASNQPAPVNYVPTRQVQPNQMTPNQMQPRPMQPNQMAPNQMAPNQMTPNQMAPNQMPPRPMQPNQMAPNQMPTGQMPTYQMPAGQIPPVNPYGSYSAPKKKNILLPILLAVFGVIVIIIGAVVIVNVIGKVKSKEDSSYESVDNMDDDEDSSDDANEEDSEDNEDSDQADSNSNDTNNTNNNDGNSASNGTEDITYAEVYGYSDLPGVNSIDSDSRFTYITNYAYNGVSSYTYMFNDIGATESEFYFAVDDYCTLLQTQYGFYYEEEFSEQQYSETGEATEYLSKENICMGITASIEDTGNYVYVAIYSLSDEADGSASTYSFENYVEYVEGRSSQSFYQSTEVYMENGMAFKLYDVIVTDLGDGTALMEANIDLAALNSDWYFYPDDFMVLPMDSEGYILSDLCKVQSVTDSSGYTMSMPFTLDTEYYYTYKVSFVVPAETTDFTIYATNVSSNGEDFAGPVYYIDMELE